MRAIAELPTIDGGAGVTVAVLDSGVSRSPVLPASRVTCLDRRGRPNNTTSSPHGTMCAGLIAGGPPVDCGVAPRAALRSYRVTQSGGEPSPIWVLSALDRALAADVDLISCSFGLRDAQPPLRDAVGRALARGVPVVAATDIGGATMEFPDDIADVLIVGPVDDRGQVPASVTLNMQVGLLAPGTVLETVRANGRPMIWEPANSSGATAIVSGFSALLLALATGPARRRLGRALPRLLVATASPVPGQVTGPGVIDPEAALAAVRALLPTL